MWLPDKVALLHGLEVPSRYMFLEMTSTCSTSSSELSMVLVMSGRICDTVALLMSG